MHMCDIMRINTLRETRLSDFARSIFLRAKLSAKETFPVATKNADKMNISRYFLRKKKFPAVPTSRSAIAIRSEGLFVVCYFLTIHVRFRSSPGRSKLTRAAERLTTHEYIILSNEVNRSSRWSRSVCP